MTDDPHARYLRTPPEEIASRLDRFQAELAAEGLDGALILQIVDLFYLTGAAQQGMLFVPASGRPVFLVRRSVRRATEDSPLPVAPLRSLRELRSHLDAAGLPTTGRLGLELDVLPAAQYLQLAGLLEGVRLADCSGAIRRVRMRKSAWEIERLRDAARRAAAMFEAVPAVLRDGLAEVELAAEIEAAGRRVGHQGLLRLRGFNQQSFYGGLLAGPSGAVPTYTDSSIGGTGLSPAYPVSAGWRRIGRGEPVLVDYVSCVDGYHADGTRTYSLGPLPPRLDAAYRTMVEIQREVVALAQPGTPASALYDRAVELALAAGLAAGFLGLGEGKVRFVGHGVGLELDELPVLAPGVSTPLEPGMVLAIEPKVAFEGVGMVGIENLWLVTAGEPERISLPGDDYVVVDPA